MVKLDTPLQSGDVVEIITDKNRKGPSADWLKFVKTHEARTHIKSSIKKKTLSSWLRGILPTKKK
jgi:GTP pyrophosphokinase